MQLSEEKKQIPEASLPSEQQEDKIQQSKEPQQSEYLQEYRQRVSKYSGMAGPEYMTSLTISFQKEGVEFKKYMRPQTSISFSIIKSSINMAVILLNAQWGQFSIDFTILNISHQNTKHGQQFSQGGFGHLYWGKLQNRNIILKCIPVRNKNSRIRALMEWFLLKIASAAEIGPHVGTYFGFDLLMYEDCIQFPMQLCEVITSNQVNVSLLYWNMAVMHNLHIAHLDIKPENIMLSPTYRKPVFIDFGLSKIVEQDQGFKTLTGYAGSINFCSKEMTQCFWQKQHFYIDLYYNDLHCLLQSVKSIHGRGVSLNQYDESDESDVDLERPTSDFQYLKLYQLKHSLVESDFKSFFNIWNQIVSEQKQSLFKNDILNFLLELIPQYRLKDLFQKLADDSDTQTPLYTKLKIAYETSHQKLSSIYLLIDDMKRQKFNKYCEEYIGSDCLSGTDDETRKLATTQLMLHLQLVKKMPYRKYAGLLLEWMSYTNNRFKVTSEQRAAAAAIYHSLFMSKTPKPLGRKLMEGVILDILRYFLQSEDIDNDTFALNMMRLYDYLVILDIGSIEQLLEWLNQIYQHPHFHYKFKHIFLMRVSQSTELNRFRVTLKQGRPRSQCYDLLSNWMAAKQRVLMDWPKKNNPLYKEYVNFNDEVKVTNEYPFQEDFMNEFGVQCIYSNIIASLQCPISEQITKMFYLYNTISINQEKKKFSYFLAYIYRHYLFNSNSRAFDLAFKKIILENLADPALYSQFSFSFLIDFAYTIPSRDLMLRVISSKSFEVLNQYLLRIHPKDLTLYGNFIVNIFNKIQIQKTYNSIETSFLFETPNSFMTNYVKASLDDHVSYIQTRRDSHKCFDIDDIFSLFTMGKALTPSLEQEIKIRLLSETSISLVQCQQCRDDLSVISGTNTLQHMLSSLCRIRQLDKASEQSKQALTSFFSMCLHLQQSIKKRKRAGQRQLALLQMVLNFGQMICCLEDSIEQQYKGIYKYYLESKTNKAISWYFKSQINNCFPILKTIELLWDQAPSEFLPFLLHLASIPQSTRLFKDYHIIFKFTGDVFIKIGDQQQYNILLSLKQILSKTPGLLPEVGTIYHILVQSLSDFKLKKKVCRQLFKIIHRVHYLFRRFIMITIFLEVASELTLNPCTKRRQLIFINNKLVKLLMIQQYSQAVKKKNKTLDPKVARLHSKINNIQNSFFNNQLFRFQIK